ncbi:MAG: PBP1A family penicillin-binding protein [Candidatus Komeilibacteria bacterium]
MPISPLRPAFQTKPLGSTNFPRSPRHHRGGFWRIFWQRIIPIIILLTLVGGIFVVGAFVWYSHDLPDPNKLIDRSVAQSTKIYDRTGEHLLYEIHGTQRRTLVNLDQIPKYAVEATIAIEDKTFYEHRGYNVARIIKSLLINVLTGQKAQGGSTLTQQLVKNAILTTEKAYSRKIKELVLSYRIEQKFTKDEILKLYFNEIPYGSTAYGIESASGIYFGKSAKDLTLAEAAVLAALPQAPSFYSPYGSHKDQLLERQRLVLKLMREQGYITADQERAAASEQVVFKTKREDITAPHFVFIVKAELAEKYGDRMVEQGGLKITTTLDWEKQQLADETVQQIGSQLQTKYGANNASLVTIDVVSGDVLALVGSRDYFDDSIDGQVNVAIQPRQPGSSLKPFVYAQLFTKGFGPSSLLFDLVTSFGSNGAGGEYKPHNYDGKEYGPVSIRQALAGSLNIPAVKALYLADPVKVIELLKNFGYTSFTDASRYGLSLVLGGGEVELIEHTNGYAALAREGVYQKYYDVLKVEDSTGRVLEEKEQPEQKRILEAQVVREITNILSDNDARAYIFGVNNNLTLGGRPVAAKSGTTNDYKDSWLMGYTPQLVTGVWVGNNNNKPMNQATGANAAGPIWQSYMAKILAAYPAVGFTAPETTVCDKIMICGQLAREVTIPVDRVTGQPATAATPPENIEQRTVKEVHDILQYADKNDPLNPSYPAHPEQDPQYENWEAPVRKWAQTNGYVSSLPNQGVNDRIKISWVEPSNNDQLSGQSIHLAVGADAPDGISRADYYLNNQFLGSSSKPPFDITVSQQASWPSGTQSLRAIVYDSIGASNSASLTVNISQMIITAPKIQWTSPQNYTVYTTETWPKTISATLDSISTVAKIDFYYVFGDQTNFAGVIDKPTSPVISIPLKQNGPKGNYKFYLITTDSAGGVHTSDSISATLQ